MEYSNNVWKKDIDFFWTVLALHIKEILLIKRVRLRDEFGESHGKVLIIDVQQKERRN